MRPAAPVPAMPDPASVPRPWLGHYPPGVPVDVAVPPVTLDALLADVAATTPDAVALQVELAAPLRRDRVRCEEWTWGQLHDRSLRSARVLADLGVGHGDRVALVLPNLPETVALLFAAWTLGAVVVPVDPSSTPHELGRVFREASVTAAVVLDDVLAGAREAAGTATRLRALLRVDPRAGRQPLHGAVVGVERAAVALGRGGDRGAARHGIPELHAQVAATPPIEGGDGPTPSDLAVLVHTGGTTGVPRGVMLTHRNLVANAHQARAWLPDARRGAEATLLALPLHHVYGLTVGLLTGVLLAARIVLVPRFQPDAVLATAHRLRPTLFPAVPAMYRALADAAAADGQRLDSLRLCLSGADALPPALVDDFARLSTAQLREGYGLSEAGPLTHANPIHGENRPGSIGLPVSGTVAVVVDPERPWRVRPPGEPGELAVHGPQVMAGYWGQPAETARVLRDGWLLTGDLAVQDATGRFRLVDRKKDVVITNGVNVYPGEVEQALESHPHVVRAAVVGEPDERRGEVVVAHVVVRDPATFRPGDLMAWARQRLAPHKVPRRLHVHETLPTSPMGKLRRHALQAAQGTWVVHDPDEPASYGRDGEEAS